MRSFPLLTGGSCGSRPDLRLRYRRVGGLRAMGRRFLPSLVRDRLHLDTPLLRDAARGREALQPVHRGPPHVVRVGGAQPLGEDVAHPGAVQHCGHRAAAAATAAVRPPSPAAPPPRPPAPAPAPAAPAPPPPPSRPPAPPPPPPAPAATALLLGRLAAGFRREGGRGRERGRGRGGRSR